MWNNGFEFEDEVRRIARSLWGATDGDGGAEIVDGRERDCIFETEDLRLPRQCGNRVDGGVLTRRYSAST